MTPDLHAIETMYAGCLFRSRLEARWAAFFDLIGWRWTYEPFDLDGYIPDFLIAGPAEAPLLVEVGPVSTRAEYDAKADKGRRAIPPGSHELLVLGVNPTFSIEDQEHPVAGLLIDSYDSAGQAHWLRCTACDSWGVVHEYNEFAARPCGHYDGTWHRGVVLREVDESWRNAGNATRYVPTKPASVPVETYRTPAPSVKEVMDLIGLYALRVPPDMTREDVVDAVMPMVRTLRDRGDRLRCMYALGGALNIAPNVMDEVFGSQEPPAP